MLKPSLDGLVFGLILGIITIGVWLWDIYKCGQKGLLLCAVVTSLSFLVFNAWTHWSSVDEDTLILWLLLINLAIALAAQMSLKFLANWHLVGGLVIAVALLAIFQLMLRDNLKLYLTLRLSSESPDINLYYWADRPDIESDWTDIYKSWPDDEHLIGDGVMTYLLNASNTSARVYGNTNFRDATFEAWAEYNASTSSQRLDFSTLMYYEDSAKNEEFMTWWHALAMSAERHEPGFIWFLVALKEHMNYFVDDDLAKVEQSLKSCLAASNSNAGLTAILTEALAVITTNGRGETSEEPVNP